MPYKNLIELEKLKEHFHEPMADVARKFGVCTTFFKRICRTYGIKRWPFRKLQSIDKKIQQMSAGDQSPQTSSKLSQLQSAREHLQSTGIPPTGMNVESPKPLRHGMNPMPRQVSSDPMAELLALAIKANNPVSNVVNMTVLDNVNLAPHPFPIGTAPMAIRNQVGGLTLVLAGPDEHLIPSYQPHSCTMMCNEQTKVENSTSEKRKHDVDVAKDEDSSPPRDKDDEDEEVSMILGCLARENLFKHSLVECKSHPEEHAECLARFDSIQGGAVYIFEIGVTGDPIFTYISRGSVDVYGLTPEQVTDPDGCQRILSVIHEDDQASFISTVQHSRINLTEWIWRGRTRIPTGADTEAFDGQKYKGIYARSVPKKLADGSVRWEGFLLEVKPESCDERHRAKLYNAQADLLNSVLNSDLK